MKLNKIQKNFRAQMEAIKKEEYYKENPVYSTVRKRNGVTRKTVGISTFFFILVLLYPAYGVIKSTNAQFTVNKHTDAIEYLNQVYEYETQFNLALNDLIESIPQSAAKKNEYLFKVSLSERELSESYNQILKLKSPSPLNEYNQEFHNRIQNILTLVHYLKTNAELNKIQTNYINNVIEEIRFSSVKSQLLLRSALDELGMRYTLDNSNNVDYIEYMSGLQFNR